MPVPSDEDITQELKSDPAHLGYAPFIESGGDGGIESLINAGQGGSGGGPQGAMCLRASVPTAQAVAYLVASDFEALTAGQIAYLQLLANMSELVFADPVTGQPTQLVANLEAIFPSSGDAATPTGQSFAALLERPCSRAEKLWGDGVVIGHLTIARVLRG